MPIAACCAVWLEVLQGEGGIYVADLDYVKALRQLCDQRGLLLMIDEVQSGIGRTGKWFAHQWAGIKPDVMTLAKGLGLRRAGRRVRGGRSGSWRVWPRKPRHDIRRRTACDARGN